MKLQRIRLRGAIGIREGVGLEEIDLDVSGLTGMVALDGDNGMGKTTLLDNMHPFRFLPSRPKKALQHHFFLRDSFREVVFDHNGHSYRCLVKIDSQSGKQEGFVYKDGSEESETAGGVREYDTYITDILGSTELFVSSVFCAQKTDDSKMTTGAIKKQYVEFLRLDELQEKSETAKRCEFMLEKVIDGLKNRMDIVREQMFSVSDSREKLTETTDELNRFTSESGIGKDRLGYFELKLSRLMHEKSDNDVKKERKTALGEKRDGIQSQIDAIVEERQHRKQELQKKIEALAVRRATHNELIGQSAEIENAESVIESIEKDLIGADSKRKDCQSKMDVAAALSQTTTSQWIKSRDALEAQISEKLKRIEEIGLKHLELSDTLNNLERKLDAADAGGDIKQIEFEISFAKDKLVDLEKRDPACTSTTCSFIVGALNSKVELPELERRKAAAAASNEASKKTIQTEIDRVKAEINGLIKQVDGLKAEKSDLNLEIASIDGEYHAGNKKLETEKSGIQARMDSVKAYIDELTEKKAQFAELAAKKSDLNVAKKLAQELDAQIDALKQKEDSGKGVDTRIEALEAEKKSVSEQIEKIEINVKIDSDIEDIELVIRQKKIDIEMLATRITGLTAKKASFEKDLETFNKLTFENNRLLERIEALRIQAIEWAYLKKAYGKDGLQALEIDLVAPLISSIANQLLSSTFGPSFQVRVDTLNDANKEVMEYWILRENGTEVLLDDLSGGQKVWVLKALRLARTMIAKEKSGIDYQSCFGDEEDGALRHGKTSENFIDLYREFIVLAKFQAAFFISHKPECIAMAEHTICFEPGRIYIQ